MSRSLKKGPFVETRLLSRITAMNEAGKKDVVKTWSRASTIFPEMVGHTIAVRLPWPSTPAASMCPCMLPSPWLVTSSASSRRLVRSVATRPNRGLTVNGN